MQEPEDSPPPSSPVHGRGRGFASFDAAKRKAVARRGGKAVQARGTAHRWNSEEAQVAGQKGGKAVGGAPRPRFLPPTTTVIECRQAFLDLVALQRFYGYLSSLPPLTTTDSQDA